MKDQVINSIEKVQVKQVQKIINQIKDYSLIEGIKDKYHSFKELYDFRLMYNAVLFNEFFENGSVKVHKSIRHHDEKLCFGGGWFIVIAELPSGQISNHYEMEHWDLFNIPEFYKAQVEFDGHTSIDVLSRMKKYTTKENTK